MNPGWSDRDEAVAAELASLARSERYKRPIALAGFMGVGKSTLGPLLAEVLERPLYDTDSYVERIAGRPVHTFFPNEELEFRRLEAKAVAELVGRGPSVIALGGGALLDKQSRTTLRNRSLLVHLHVPWRELRGDVPALVASRPLLQGRTLAEIHELYLIRLDTYRHAALRITVGRQGAALAAADVLRALRSLEGPQLPPGDAPVSRTAVVLKALAHSRSSNEMDMSL